MTKEELMLLTIKQLTEYFFMHPECFELEDPDFLSSYFNHSTIMFQSKNDPNSNPRTVTLTYNETTRSMVCNIYFRFMIGVNHNSIKPDASASIKVEFKWFNKSYKMFKALRNHIVNKKKNDEHNQFLQKLHSVFPGTFDDYIFGKPK